MDINQPACEPTKQVARPTAGRVKGEVRAEEIRQYAWDAEGRLRTGTRTPMVAGVGGTPLTTRYRYDHAGRRVASERPSGTASWVWGAGSWSPRRRRRGQVPIPV
jgi:YD repeat-containing protein